MKKSKENKYKTCEHCGHAIYKIRRQSYCGPGCNRAMPDTRLKARRGY